MLAGIATVSSCSSSCTTSFHIGRCISCPISRRLVINANFSTHNPSGKRRVPRTRERVLRYPDGNVRLIRYPALETLEETDISDSSSLWDSNRQHASGTEHNSNVNSSSQLAGTSAGVEDALPQSLDQQLEFLESIFAASSSVYASQVQDIQQLTSTSYQILEHCPWLLPRKLFVLVKQSMESSTGNMYSLRTRISKPGVSSDLAKVLGRGHSDDFLDVSEMKDGVLAFQSDAAALQFADEIELQSFAQVSVLEMDSHYLFRNTCEAQALVVYLPESDFVPKPHELSSALKSHKPWDAL